MTFSPAMHVEAVRSHMQRVLSSNERKAYRGITMTGMTGVMFEELFGIETTEDLIRAEYYGRQSIPCDDPTGVYLFSAGHGLTARYHPDMANLIIASEQVSAVSPISSKTIAQLDVQFRNMERPVSAEEAATIEGILEYVARDYISWWEDVKSTRSAASAEHSLVEQTSVEATVKVETDDSEQVVKSKE